MLSVAAGKSERSGRLLMDCQRWALLTIGASVWLALPRSDPKHSGFMGPDAMGKRIVTIRGSKIVLLLALFSVNAAAQAAPAAATTEAQPSESTQPFPAEERPAPGQVLIEGRGPILTVYETVGGRTPEQRASAIEERIIAVAKDGGAAVASVETHEGWTEILMGGRVIMAVTDTDARMAGVPREQLVAQYGKTLEEVIRDYREEHSWRMLLRGVLKTILVSLVLVAVLWLLRRLRFALRDQIERQIRASAQVQPKSAWRIIGSYTASIALGLGAGVRWLVILGLLETYLTVVLSYFSSTRELSLTVTNWVFSQLGSLTRAAVNYLPDLLVVSVIALLTYYAFRLLRLIFGEISTGNLKIRGFYPDWAEPTEKLLRILVLILALTVAFPYLPGAKSPAFRGVSIFFGVLLSLGSSSAVANAIAGVILTYMRSFLTGDWVRIGDTTGEVIEKTLLVTRVLTPKSEIITIPNATVMSGAVTNYSVEAKKSGVIFHTAVSIGYNAPWRTVHQLLTSAALATPHVLEDPAPFVLQNALNDFYVSYELNAFTSAPREMLNIYSDLHRNIQDKFNEAGVEICSPHFASLRDGNVIAVPEQYIGPDYKAPGFRMAANDRDPKNSSPLKRTEKVREIG
jgi:small-conductance mechanosensitive channel